MSARVCARKPSRPALTIRNSAHEREDGARFDIGPLGFRTDGQPTEREPKFV